MASSINASTSGAGGVITTADNTGILNIQTASTTAVTIDASQNVGIGTSSPTSKLDVRGEVKTLNDAAAAGVIIKRTDGVNANGAVNFVGSDDTVDASVRMATDVANALTFTTGGTTERMRITSAGALCLGGTSTIAGYVFTMYHTDTNGMAYKYNGTSEANSCSFQNGNGQVGRIYTSGSNTTYSTSSDYRLKENIVSMTGALDKVALLNPVTYTWKVDGTNGQGFIAHELQAVVPDCVGGTKDAVDAEGNPVYQDVDTSYLVATLTAAIQEQQALITSLTARITALEGASL